MARIAHVFHAEQLRDLANGKAYARGERYHQEGRVSALRRDGKTIKGRVSGTREYDVSLWVNGDRIAYTCSCPMGEEGLFCKHCVAVALSLTKQHTPPPVDEPAPDVGGMVYPPRPLPDARRSVFLAGSIDMGDAPEWQSELAASLSDVDELVLFNPRRVDWDASWEQSITNDEFVKQVEWELDALERAAVIAMYFAAESKAPITLLELGLHARSGKLIVCCPAGYWRKGNVDVVCRRFAVHQVHDLDALAVAVRARVQNV